MSSLLKSPVIVVCVTVAFLGLVASVIVIQLNDLSPASFINSVITLVTGVALAFGIGKVQKQTNGTLSARDARIDQLTDLLSQFAAHLPTETATAILSNNGATVTPVATADADPAAAPAPAFPTSTTVL